MRSMKTLTLLALTAFSTYVSAQTDGVAWRNDLDAAKAEAKQTGKLVLAHFWTDSCGPCQVLEQNVFSQPSVAMGLSRDYVPVKLNAQQHPELAEMYGVTRVPTDAVLTADGLLVKAFVSPSTPMDYVGYTTQLANAYKAQLGAPFAAVAATAPVQPAISNNVPSNLGDRYSSATTPASKPNPPIMNQAAVTPASKPAPQTVTPPAVTQTATTVAQSTPQKPQAPATQQLPPGSPPLGFEGYCPVTMKKDWRWAKGDTRYGAIHRGRTYLFTTAEAQKEFLANPEKYSPVLEGADPVVAIDQKQTVNGARDFAVEYKDRFYFFSSQQTLEKFWTNPEGYATGVQRVATAAPEGVLQR